MPISTPMDQILSFFRMIAEGQLFALLPTLLLYIILAMLPKIKSWSNAKRVFLSVVIVELLGGLIGINHTFRLLLTMLGLLPGNKLVGTVVEALFIILIFLLFRVLGALIGIALVKYWRTNKKIFGILLFVLCAPVLIGYFIPSVYDTASSIKSERNIRQESVVAPIETNQSITEFIAERCWKNESGGQYVFTANSYEFHDFFEDTGVYESGSWEIINETTLKTVHQDHNKKGFFDKTTVHTVGTESNMLVLDGILYAGAPITNKPDPLNPNSGIRLFSKYDCGF